MQQHSKNSNEGNIGDFIRNRNNRKRHQRRTFSGNSVEQLNLSSGSDQYNSEKALFSEENESPEDQTFESNPRRRSTMGDKVEGLRAAFSSGLDDADGKKLHKVIKASKDVFDASTFLKSIQYQGFNRNTFIKSFLTKMTPKELVQFAILGAVRGTNFEKIVQNTDSIPIAMKTSYNAHFKKKAVKADDITVSRCSAAVPQWVSYFLTGTEKRFPDLECPPSLQFPAAAALPMSKEIRLAHIQFSMRFSSVIGGKFDENIYKAMMQNCLPLTEIPEEIRATLGIVDGEISQDTSLIESAKSVKSITN